jgi:hypothetical protein
MDLSSKSDQQIRNLIENHERLGETSRPLYLQALAERARRSAPELDLQKTFDCILTAARAEKFISHKDIADASGAEWSKVRHKVPAKLWDIVQYAHHHGWPMLSAIVVNKPNIATGKMDPATLKGFSEAARLLGHEFSDPEAFLADQQKAVFDWAKRGERIEFGTGSAAAT